MEQEKVVYPLIMCIASLLMVTCLHSICVRNIPIG